MNRIGCTVLHCLSLDFRRATQSGLRRAWSASRMIGNGGSAPGYVSAITLVRLDAADLHDIGRIGHLDQLARGGIGIGERGEVHKFHAAIVRAFALQSARSER